MPNHPARTSPTVKFSLCCARPRPLALGTLNCLGAVAVIEMWVAHLVLVR